MANFHSLLFIPVKERFLSKVKNVKADAVVLDLEDSIPPSEKSMALDILVHFLLNNEQPTKTFIRINRDNIDRELSALCHCRFDGIMIPKFESIDVISDVYDHVGKKQIIALIETPLGMANLSAISSSDYTFALAFGAEDYTAKCNMDNDFETLYFYRSNMVMHAKAYKRKVYDTPSFIFKDFDAFSAEVEQIKKMGFDGKLAIHPNQVPIINQVYNNYDLENISKIVELFESGNYSVLQFEGKIYEKPHIDRFKRILKTHEE